jgi:hypothetical protein
MNANFPLLRVYACESADDFDDLVEWGKDPKGISFTDQKILEAVRRFFASDDSEEFVWGVCVTVRSEPVFVILTKD